jgi:hypothetical protein
MLDLNELPEEGEVVNTRLILSRISDDQIFRFYIGDFSRSMCSPLRKDNVPSFSVYYSRHHGKWLYKDHATGDYGDCFDIVRAMYKTSLIGACVIINKDFDLGYRNPEKIDHTPPKRAIPKRNIDLPKEKELAVKFRNWQKCDTEYWTDKYGLNEKQLLYYNVRPIQLVFLGNDIIASHSYSNPIYAYTFYKDGKFTYKIYKPLSPDKRYKWMSSTNRTVLQGWDQLPKEGELLVITKALKDVMVYRTFGYPAIALQNEVSVIKDTVLNELRGRFNHIVINQDNDEAGIIGTETLHNLYGLPYYYLDIETEAKDISDYREKFGEERTGLLIKNKLNEIL